MVEEVEQQKRAPQNGVATPRPPGELAHREGHEYFPTRVTVTDYDGRTLTEKELTDLDEVTDLVARPTTTWINVTGLKDLSVLQKLGAMFDLHPLILEDVLSCRHPPKIEDYGTTLFVIIRKLRSGEEGEISTEQVSMILGPRFLLSFHETGRDPFEGVRQRIRQGRSRIRNSGPDYLAYALLDAIMDTYLPALERYGDRIEQLEEETIHEPTHATGERIQDLKREIIHLRQLSWSLRELFTHISRLDDELVSSETQVFMRDVQDHARRVQESLESHRELCEGLYQSYVSN